MQGLIYLFALNINFTTEFTKVFRKVSQRFFNGCLINSQSSQSFEHRFYHRVKKCFFAKFRRDFFNVCLISSQSSQSFEQKFYRIAL